MADNVYKKAAEVLKSSGVVDPEYTSDELVREMRRRENVIGKELTAEEYDILKKYGHQLNSNIEFYETANGNMGVAFNADIKDEIDNLINAYSKDQNRSFDQTEISPIARTIEEREKNEMLLKEIKEKEMKKCLEGYEKELNDIEKKPFKQRDKHRVKEVENVLEADVYSMTDDELVAFYSQITSGISSRYYEAPDNIKGALQSERIEEVEGIALEDLPDERIPDSVYSTNPSNAVDTIFGQDNGNWSIDEINKANAELDDYEPEIGYGYNNNY